MLEVKCVIMFQYRSFQPSKEIQMAINLDKINQALDKLDPTKSNGGGNQDAIIKLDEGEHNIRIAPYKHDPEMPFQEMW